MDILSLVGERTGDTYLWAFNNGYFLLDIFLIAAFLLTALLVATLYNRPWNTLSYTFKHVLYHTFEFYGFYLFETDAAMLTI